MFLAGLAAVSRVPGQDVSPGVPAEDAWRAIGKSSMVCGQVVDSNGSSAIPHAPIYLYLDRPHPDQVFTVLIPFARREVFGDSPEKAFRGKHVCVTGRIEADAAGGAGKSAHKAQVVVEQEEQIVVE